MFGSADVRLSVSRRGGGLRVDAGAPRGGPALPVISSDEMSSILQSCGGRVVARTDHGLLFAVLRRLIFLRHAPVVALNDLHDILRNAWIPPGRLSEMLEDLRSPKTPPLASGE
jgi:hypothetical protein